MGQPRHPQIHRPRPHRHQCQPAHPAPYILQEQEVPAAGSASEADEGDSEAAEQEGSESGDGEAEEEDDAFPDAEVCCQGRWRLTMRFWVGMRGDDGETYLFDSLG